MNRFCGLAACVVLACGTGAAMAEDKPAEPKPAEAAGQTDLKLFEKGVEWTFAKNNGDGSFVVGADGEKPVGTMNYDFTGKNPSQKTPYVLASVQTSIADGATEVQLSVRSARKQKVTFRLVDDTDQTHQYKGSLAGSGAWEPIKIPLTKKLEHWGGANDGKVHFPIKKIVLSVPAPPEDPKTGKVEFADIVAGAGAQ